MRAPRYLVLLALGIAIAVGCVAAGVWQVHRYDWKRGANHALRSEDHARTEPVADVLATDRQAGKDLQFRRVTARGRYDAGDQLLVRNREVNDAPAYLVLTRLRTDAGPTLLVVRGWFAVRGAATTTPSIPAPPRGEVSLTARVYPSEPASSHQRDLPPRQIDRLHVPDLAQGPTYGGYVELIRQTPRSSSLALLPAPDLSNPAGGAFELQHLAYVFQWFLFALIALALPFVLARIEAMRQHEGPPRDLAAPVGATLD